MVATQEEASTDYVTKEASTTRNGETIGVTMQETTPTIPKDSRKEPTIEKQGTHMSIGITLLKY